MEKITSRENAKVKYACRLASSGAFRRAEGGFLRREETCSGLRPAAKRFLWQTRPFFAFCPLRRTKNRAADEF